MSVTLSDIAKATRTSISTVSRVLTGVSASRRISKETRDRILQAAQDVGYRPNLLARSLRTRKTHTIALLVSDIANPWFGLLASVIEQSLHQRGYSLMVCNSGEDASLEDEYLKLLPQKGVDGLIIVPLATREQQLTAHLPPSLPLVLIDRPVPGIPATIASDPHQASTALCDALAQLSVKKVALVRGPEHVITHRRRSAEIHQRFHVISEFEGPAQRQTGQSAWQGILAARPDAVVCTNNFLGQGVIEQMAHSPWQIPIACFDEIPLLQLLPVPVVCSVQDVQRLATGAVQMLFDQIAGQTPHAQSLPTNIIFNPPFARLLPQLKSDSEI